MKNDTRHFTVSSPNEDIRIEVRLTDKLSYSINYKKENILRFSPLSMTLHDGTVLGDVPHIKSHQEKSVDDTIKTVWGIRSEIVEQYNELTLEMSGNYSVVFRAYNDGVAYRFRTNFSEKIKIADEEVAYNFPKDVDLFAHVVGDFQTSYEKLYTKYKVTQVVEAEFISLPLLVNQGAVKLVISEADLYDYPGMYLKRFATNNRPELSGLFPKYPTKAQRDGIGLFNLRVTERADYLAKTEGKHDFPWRMMVIANEDKQLVDNDLVFKLSRPKAIQTDWVRPGKVAWDWFNDCNLTGVDFETGVNNATYEYFIDFAAKNKLEYIILDEGWSSQMDLLLPNPAIDLPHLIAYAKARKVEILLWCVWHVIHRQMEMALDQFVEWGAVGIKVDFIDRDDQVAIHFQEKLAIECAKRKLLVNYHGCSKPVGLHRTYPNVINYEGVRGNEYNKFDVEETPAHNVDLVYTRMLAGPMDYTPGSLRNSTKGNFQTNFSKPMSHGTRCHQLAMFVVYYAPMQMLCDAPTAYEKYPDILAFLADVPTTWDDTHALDGKIGEYVAIARKKGTDWYIGAMTDWSERDIILDLSFLDEGSYQATFFTDGVNANRDAEDYQMKKYEVDGSSKIKVTLKSGGGVAVRLELVS